VLEAMGKDGTIESASMIELFSRLIEAGQPIRVIYVTGHWLDVDDAKDLAAAKSFL
jgi:phosphoenolpyruvate phosphomutase